LAEAWMRGVTARVRGWARCGDGTSFEPYKDREVHYGEEDKSEETVHQKEEEGRSGPQEAENDEGVSEKVDQEEVGAQGRSEAPLGAQAHGFSNARRRTGTDALLEPAQRLRRRWRFRHLTSSSKRGERRRQAPPPALHSPLGANSIHGKAVIGGDWPADRGLYENGSFRFEEVRYAGDLQNPDHGRVLRFASGVQDSVWRTQAAFGLSSGGGRSDQ
jgi:hypothetical protein